MMRLCNTSLSNFVYYFAVTAPVLQLCPSVGVVTSIMSKLEEIYNEKTWLHFGIGLLDIIKICF
jgi:hypothetical protein